MWCTAVLAIVSSFSLLYGVISYSFAYYGEMMTYLGMTLPMDVLSLTAWLKNPYNGNRSEVRVSLKPCHLIKMQSPKPYRVEIRGVQKTGLVMRYLTNRRDGSFFKITAALKQAVEVVLAQYLVYGDSRGVGQIQTSQTVPHRYSQTPIVIFEQKILGQTLCLLAEKEIAAVGKPSLRICSRSLGGEAEELRIRMLFEEIVKPVVVEYVKAVPVVETGSFQLCIVDGKSERTDQMQCGARGGTGARDVAGVLRYLGLVEYDVYFH